MLSEKTLKRIKQRTKSIKSNIETKNVEEEEYVRNKDVKILEKNSYSRINERDKKEYDDSSSTLNTKVVSTNPNRIKNISKENRISVSNIAINVEEELSNQQENEYCPTKTSRTLERNFIKIIEACEENKEDYKDENGNYSVDLGVQAAIAAILIESTKKNSLIDKIIRNKAENIDMNDTIIYFDNLIKYTEGKMDEEVREAFLYLQDKSTGYSLTTILFNIQHTLMALYKNIQVYPYEYQVTIMQELFQEVFVKFKERMAKDVLDFVKANIEKRLIEKDLQGVNEYPNTEFEEYYRKIDEEVMNILNGDIELREKIEKDFNCNINEL